MYKVTLLKPALQNTLLNIKLHPNNFIKPPSQFKLNSLKFSTNAENKSIIWGKVLNQKAKKQLNREFQGVCALLRRSGLQQQSNWRQLHTSYALSNKESGASPPQGPPKKPDKDDDTKISSFLAKVFLWMLTAYMAIAVISLLFPGPSQSESIRYVSWNEFVHHMLAKGEVEEIIVRPDIDIVTIILYDGAIIKGKRVDQKTFHMNVVDVEKFEERIRDAEKKLNIKDTITVSYERGSESISKLLMSLFLAGLLMSILARGRNFRAPISMDTFSNFTRAKFTLVDPVSGQGKGVRFIDVAGLKEAKIEVMEFVDYLKRPEHYKSLGAKVPRGALLLGPPGCGKTLLAKAVATESSVPFLSMNGSEFIEMIGGLGAARVRDLFKEAKKRSPCIIYIDEIDAIGRKRSGGTGGNNPVDGSSGESEQTLNQLLVEMDGMVTKDGVIILASTNRADVLDKALLRPGRFDRHILIDLPTLEERQQLFETHLKGISLEMKPDNYCRRMASLTPGFSGADIANICNEAALHAARNKQKKVTGVDLEYAVERVVGGTEKRSHAMSPQDKKVVAYHESGHALVGWMLKHTDALLKITIVPRTSLALGFAQYTPTDQKLYTTEQLFDRMCMTLGGRVAESLTFNRITTGAQNDLQKVTKMAYAQIRKYGMNNTVGLLSFDEGDTSDEKRSGRRPYSKKLASIMDDEVNKLITKAYLKTEEVLRTNKDKLTLLAEELLKKETLNYADVEKLLGPPPYGQKRLVDFAEFDLPLKSETNSNEKHQNTVEKNVNAVPKQ